MLWAEPLDFRSFGIYILGDGLFREVDTSVWVAWCAGGLGLSAFLSRGCIRWILQGFPLPKPPPTLADRGRPRDPGPSAPISNPVASPKGERGDSTAISISG